MREISSLMISAEEEEVELPVDCPEDDPPPEEYTD